jgi:hypothetical protein
MGFFGFLIIVFLAVLILKGLFNSEWREKSQDKIDGIKKERIFWNLKKMWNNLGYFKDDINDIFWIYSAKLTGDQNYNSIFSDRMDMHMYTEKEEENKYKNKLNLSIVSKTKDGFANIVNLNKAIANREKFINKILTTDIKVIKLEDIVKELKKYKEDKISNSDYQSRKDEVEMRCRKLFYEYTSKIDKSDEENKNLSDNQLIFKARESFAGKSFHYEGDGDKIIKDLIEVKTMQFEMVDIIDKCILKKIVNDKSRKKSRRILKELTELFMLRDCVSDYTLWYMGTNGIERAMWRLIEIFI